jgi:hypothetical protein
MNATAAATPVFRRWEIRREVSDPGADPFAPGLATGELTGPAGERRPLEGFWDGDAFVWRALPTEPGPHHLTIRVGETDETLAFEAEPSGHPGLVQTHPEFPFHFRWSARGEPFYYNATTAYWLLCWRDEWVIDEILDRFARHGINRIRVAINGRVVDGSSWCEPVPASPEFNFRLNPWVAQDPEALADPGFDTTKFNLEFWRKIERMLDAADARGIQVSLLPYLDGQKPGVDPFGKANAGCADEERYYRYLVARLAAFPNAFWNVTNEYQLFREEAWTAYFGRLIAERDPYGHSLSVHGHGDFPFRGQSWPTYAEYQMWDDAGGYALMRENRRKQQATFRLIPQVNEEYGYEDHYPVGWGNDVKAPHRNAKNRLRLAWEIAFAGGYSCNGERANQPGMGGWITGRADDETGLLEGLARLRKFITSFDWYRAEPEEVPGAYVLNAGRFGWAAWSPDGAEVVVPGPGFLKRLGPDDRDQGDAKPEPNGGVVLPPGGAVLWQPAA